MIRPPSPRRTVPLLAGAAAVLCMCALGGIVAHGITSTVAAATPRPTVGPERLDGAIPGATENALSCPVPVPGVRTVTETARTTAAGRTAVTTAYVAGPTQTVTATRTAWATATTTATVTPTVTATVTETAIAAAPTS